MKQPREKKPEKTRGGKLPDAESMKAIAANAEGGTKIDGFCSSQVATWKSQHASVCGGWRVKLRHVGIGERTRAKKGRIHKIATGTGAWLARVVLSTPASNFGLFHQMTNTTTNRVCGVLLFLAGIPFTIWLVWLVREAAFDYHIVMAGPMVTVFGAALAILGRTDLRNSDGTPSRVRMMLVTLPCALTGMLALHATQEHDFPPLEKLLDSYKQKAAPPEHVVTREEVDAAIKEVNTRAAELQKVRASLNTKDAAAVKKFDLDVAAYTERNHAVAALQAKYTAAQAAK